MKKIYYKSNGQIDKIDTFINNNAWLVPVVFILSIIIIGLIESL